MLHGKFLFLRLWLNFFLPFVSCLGNKFRQRLAGYFIARKGTSTRPSLRELEVQKKAAYLFLYNIFVVLFRFDPLFTYYAKVVKDSHVNV